MIATEIQGIQINFVLRPSGLANFHRGAHPCFNHPQVYKGLSSDPFRPTY